MRFSGGETPRFIGSLCLIIITVPGWSGETGIGARGPGPALSSVDLYRLTENPRAPDAHEDVGLSQLDEREGDHHNVSRGRSLYQRPIDEGLARDAQNSGRSRGDETVWKTLGIAAGVILLSSTADRRADRWAGRHGNDHWVESVADVGNALPFVVLAGAGLFALNDSNPRLAGTSYTAVQSGLTAGALAVAAKYAIGRLRPDLGRGSGEFEPFKGRLSDKSFPSERTTLMWATVTPFAKEYEMPWLYGVAALTNFGRVADRRHWLSDTVAGSLLGYAVGSLLWNAHRKPDRYSPQVIFTGDGVAVAWQH